MMKMASALIQCMMRTGAGWRRCEACGGDVMIWLDIVDSPHVGASVSLLADDVPARSPLNQRQHRHNCADLDCQSGSDVHGGLHRNSRGKVVLLLQQIHQTNEPCR